ncbi:MAG: hypothetical protein J1E34_01630 [Oscillospiraceae bacterium]|nr:hypothetical protein [Oscillospiraceae bacterium]
MQDFNGLTVVILASNERELLRRTIRLVLDYVQTEDLAEIIVFLKSANCPAADELKLIRAGISVNIPIREYVQQEKKLPEALIEIPPLIKSSHFLIMFSDLATDAASIPLMVEEAKRFPEAVVCASKWHKDSEIHDYGFLRMLCTRFMNTAAALILNSDGKDLFSIFQIYPLEMVLQLDLSDSKSFVFDYTLMPIAMGIKYIEVPTRFFNRTEEKSNYNLWAMLKTGFAFLRTAVRLRIRYR